MLAQPPFADDTRLVKVVYEKRGKPRMVFERGDDDKDAKAAWQLVEPTNCKASNWMVDNIGLVVKRLKYASKSTIGEPGAVSLEDAGLRPKPAARFAVTSEDGETVEVEIGNTLIGNQNAYVYLPSRPDELFVSAEEYGNILDREVVEFRENCHVTLC